MSMETFLGMVLWFTIRPHLVLQMRPGDCRGNSPHSGVQKHCHQFVGYAGDAIPRSAGALTASLLASGTSVPDVFEHVLAQWLVWR